MAHALKEILDHASAEVTEEGMGGEKATEMSSRLQATLGKSDNARRGAVVTHVVLWAGTNDMLDPSGSRGGQGHQRWTDGEARGSECTYERDEQRRHLGFSQR